MAWLSWSSLLIDPLQVHNLLVKSWGYELTVYAHENWNASREVPLVLFIKNFRRNLAICQTVWNIISHHLIKSSPGHIWHVALHFESPWLRLVLLTRQTERPRPQTPPMITDNIWSVLLGGESHFSKAYATRGTSYGLCSQPSGVLTERQPDVQDTAGRGVELSTPVKWERCGRFFCSVFPLWICSVLFSSRGKTPAFSRTGLDTTVDLLHLEAENAPFPSFDNKFFLNKKNKYQSNINLKKWSLLINI